MILMKAHILAVSLLVAPTLAAATADSYRSAYIDRAEAFVDAGNYAAALEQLHAAAIPEAHENAEALMLRAKALFALGRYDEAMADRLAVVRQYPASEFAPDAHAGVAECLFAMGEYSRALEAYEAVPYDRLGPDAAAAAYFGRGVAAYECGQPDEAAGYFTFATTADTTRSDANYWLGVIAFDNGDYDAAARHFALVSPAGESGRRVPVYTAQIEFMRGQWPRAEAAAKTALRNAPADRRAELMRIAGEALCRQGKEAEGLDYLRRYLDATSEPELSALYIVGTDDYRHGRYAEAAERLAPVAAGADGAMKQSAYLFIGQSLLQQGDRDAAILAFNKAVEVPDGDKAVEEAAYYNYISARLDGAAVPFGDAAATFEEFLRRYPSGAYAERVAAALADIYIADHDYDRAIERLSGIRQPSRRTRELLQRAHYSRAWNAIGSHDYVAADAHLNDAAAIDGDASVALEVKALQGITAMQRGDNAAAEGLFSDYIRRAPSGGANVPVVYYRLGYALYNQGKGRAAASAFERALPGLGTAAKADALNRMGDIRQGVADFDGAALCYNRALETDNSDYAVLQLARMKGYGRDYVGKIAALDDFERRFASSPLIPDALLERTQALISTGRNDDAIAVYRRLIADYPATSQGRRAYLEMAMTLLDSGRTDEALAAYRTVISLFPTSEEAARAAALLKNLYVEQGRAADYMAFIESIDNAPRVDAADAEEMAYTSALNSWKGSGSAAQAEDFARRYPESVHRAEMVDILMRDAARRGDVAGEEAYADELMARYPDSRYTEGAMAVKAGRLYARNDIPGALAVWEQLVERASDASVATVARVGAMRAARDMGDNALAASYADALLESSLPDTERVTVAEAKFTKACALEADGKVDEAIALWQSQAGNTADEFGAKSAYRAAEALYEKADLKEALRAARALTQSGSPHRYWVARGFILMSDIYSAQGKDFEAREYLEALRENYPGGETDIFMMIDARLNKEDNEEQ